MRWSWMIMQDTYRVLSTYLRYPWNQQNTISWRILAHAGRDSHPQSPLVK